MSLGTRHIQRSTLLWLAALALVSPSQAAFQQTPDPKPVSRDSAETFLGAGYDALRQDRYDAAITEFRAALRLDPKLVPRARFPLAVALF